MLNESMWPFFIKLYDKIFFIMPASGLYAAYTVLDPGLHSSIISRPTTYCPIVWWHSSLRTRTDVYTGTWRYLYCTLKVQKVLDGAYKIQRVHLKRPWNS